MDHRRENQRHDADGEGEMGDGERRPEPGQRQRDAAEQCEQGQARRRDQSADHLEVDHDGTRLALAVLDGDLVTVALLHLGEQLWRTACQLTHRVCCPPDQHWRARVCIR